MVRALRNEMVTEILAVINDLERSELHPSAFSIRYVLTPIFC